MSLGLLRQSHNPRQTVTKIVTSQLKRKYETDKFKRIKANQLQHTLIHGFDDAIIAYRVPSPGPQVNESLLSSVNGLRHVRNSEYSGIDRGEHISGHYTVWSPYTKRPCFSAEFSGRQRGRQDIHGNQPFSLGTNEHYSRQRFSYGFQNVLTIRTSGRTRSYGWCLYGMCRKSRNRKHPS